MTTAEFEKPAKASLGLSTLVTSSKANELRATMSLRTLSAINATMVKANTAITMVTWPVDEANHVVRLLSISMVVKVLSMVTKIGFTFYMAKNVGFKTWCKYYILIFSANFRAHKFEKLGKLTC